MKKSLLFISTAVLMLSSCKKDRECSCKVVENTVTPKTKTDVVYSYNLTMKDVGLKTAFQSCIHTKEEVKENDSTTVFTDINCSLK